MRSYSQCRATFEQNPVLYIIKYYDLRVKEVRMKVYKKAERINIQYYKDYTLLHKRNIISSSANEITRMIDAVEEE